MPDEFTWTDAYVAKQQDSISAERLAVCPKKRDGAAISVLMYSIAYIAGGEGLSLAAHAMSYMVT
jgi:hypothetical protein